MAVAGAIISGIMVTISFKKSFFAFPSCSWIEFQKHLLFLNVSLSNHYCFNILGEGKMILVKNEEAFGNCINLAIGKKENIFFAFAMKFRTDDEKELMESKEFIYGINEKGILMEHYYESPERSIAFGLTKQTLVLWDYANVCLPVVSASGGYDKIISFVAAMSGCKISDVHVELAYDETKENQAGAGEIGIGVKSNLMRHSFSSRDVRSLKKNHAEKMLFSILFIKLLRVKDYANVVLISADQDLLPICEDLGELDPRRKWTMIYTHGRSLSKIMRESPLWAMQYALHDILPVCESTLGDRPI
ncbi:MAG: hypothetical protein Hyperionvirus4_90 [Hyperionvirus sp.]|uniref:NYN domain-containing protein n=1 Tax=Hyperionvirus sp. TaxID=2487770 RepID=A0A3G5A7B9_9VIRU|nr:MAG: hypothetical protein Hyperionvirus4_90 [Hyperionvirus sp.]